VQTLFLGDGGKEDKVCDNDDTGDCCSLDCGNGVVSTRARWNMGTIDLSLGESAFISERSVGVFLNFRGNTKQERESIYDMMN